MRSQVIAALMVTGVLAAWDPAAEAASSIQEVRFTSSRPGEVVVPVFIEGHGPFRFLLDTGATHTAILESVRSALGSTLAARTTLTTSVDSLLCLVVSLAELSVGPARAETVLATVLPAEASAALGAGIDGILGQDFLSQFNFTIDYRRSRIAWGDSPERAASSKLRLVPAAGRYLVELVTEPGARDDRLRVVPDSGADVMVLFGRRQLQRLGASTARSMGRLETLSGSGTVHSATLPMLRVGTITLWDQIVAVLPERADGENGDGLLPLHVFARVSFNNREQYLVIER